MIKRVKHLLRVLNPLSFKHGEFAPGHYYSPIPSKQDIVSYKERLKESLALSEDINIVNQEEIIIELAQYYDTIKLYENKTEGKRFYLNNSFFEHSDSIFLASILRKFKPKNIIEVGSGFSTALMLDIIDEMDSYEPTITCIEPYPDRLKSLVWKNDLRRINLVEKTVQSVPSKYFKSLKDGDMLFVDSSHVIKYGSDVQDIFFRIMPLLAKGVIVHFHDIHNNFEYCHEWLTNGRHWNEAYILKAFLTSNPLWEVLLFADKVNKEHPQLINTKLPLCGKDHGGSIYIRKVA